MTQPVRIGIVGCGDVMRGAYMPLLDNLRRRGLAEVVIACDRTERNRALVRDECGISTFTTDLHDVVSAREVDLVLVLTSGPTHGMIARAALDAGKHVLVEKPMAATLEEAAQLMAVAGTSRGYLLCAPFVALSPTYQAIWRRIQQGDVGTVLSARARYGWAGPDWAPWFYRSGGALIDLGVYNVTTLTGLLGPARRVTAMSGVAIPEREINGERIQVEADDNAHVLIDFGASVYAVVTTGFTIQRYRSPAVELYGSTGTIQMLGDDWAPQGYELWQNSVGAWQVFEEADPSWFWADGLRYLVECIQHEVAPIIQPEQAFHVLEIMLKAQQSGRDGRARLVESTFTPPAFAHVASDPRRGSHAHLRHDPRRAGLTGRSEP